MFTWMDEPVYQRHTYKHTAFHPDCVEIGSAGGPVLLGAWNCVVGAAAVMSVMDYSGKLAEGNLAVFLG